ncbi:lipopolysaccharide heptosyltransferase I [Roseateles oligotrophus]|uniref:Lipopolysaccharide heptosyltransferase 1 n=1 Tax=Roseateles oligotrophus TaxID=1769250 RepID=A0ABT2YHE2_9BURK|nr:lipopolysaccharide heptosyltransferase I [Roseateles oligotrophus]MCV2369443.1 lipopolysaccharide heptosyltransferase I [Roseateles oligotrophus]
MSTNRPVPSDPDRILIVRLSALGDVVLSSGLIPSLLSRWPKAQITWLVEPAAAPLLKHNPRLHEVIVLPTAEWKNLWRAGKRLQALREIWRFRASLRAARFDLVIDPQGLLKSGLMAWFTGAPRRVNLKPRESSQWLMHESVRPGPGVGIDATLPIVAHEYRDLAVYLGAASDSYRMDLAVGEAARQLASARLEQAKVGSRYAVLAAFTTRPQKHWIESNWAALADGLLAQGLTPLLLGGPSDLPAAQRIAASNPAIVNLVGQFKLDETVAVISRASLLVGVDTGLSHMAIALNIPTVALFGSTTPYLRGPDARTQVLYERLDCSPCNRKPTCHGRFDCMRQLDVARVLKATSEVRQASTL